MIQNIWHFLLNWPMPWGEAGNESILLFLINILNGLFGWFGIFILIDDYTENKLKLKKLFFFLLFYFFFPLSTTISAIGLVIIYAIFVLIGWIFDLDNGLHHDFFKWIKNLFVKPNKPNKPNNRKINSKNYCTNCKYKNNLGKYTSTINMKCQILNLEFPKGDCLCSGKLFENVSRGGD